MSKLDNSAGIAATRWASSCRHPGRLKLASALIELLALVLAEHARHDRLSIRAPDWKYRVLMVMSTAVRTGAHQAPGRALHQPSALDQHVQLRLRRNPVVEFLDRRPERAHVEHLPGHGEAAGQNRRRRPGLLGQTEGERRSGAVDELIGHHGGDDLAPQSVAAHLRG